MNSKLFGGILIITGTTIGAGMLALPVTTALTGLIPSLIDLTITWLFMLFSALLLLEVIACNEPGTNLITLARRTLGRVGEVIAWTSYLLLLYALVAAYLSGSRNPFIVAVACAIFTWFGIRYIDFANRVLTICMAVGFFLVIFFLFPRVQRQYVTRMVFPALLIPLPVVITAFGYHIVLPSLYSYLEGRVRDLVRCILIGSLIPLVAYILWQVALMGSLPAERISTMPTLGGPIVQSAYTLLSISVILTSLLGVLISLWDFLADGLRLHHRRRGRLLLTALTFMPPLIWVWLYPEGFILALHYSGAFVAILLGLLPVAMVWAQRYYWRRTSAYRAPGGRLLLMVAACFFALVLAMEFAT